MFKNIMKTLGLTAPIVSAEDIAELERVTLEDRLVEMSLKAYKNNSDYHADLPNIDVTELTDPEVVREAMEANFSLGLLPNETEAGTPVSKVEYERAAINRERDPWGSVSKRTIR